MTLTKHFPRPINALVSVLLLSVYEFTATHLIRVRPEAELDKQAIFPFCPSRNHCRLSEWCLDVWRFISNQ
jgi:hypothetical protein